MSQTAIRWHPWRHLRDHHPEVVVSCQHELHATRMGFSRGRRIWLCSTLTQAERRCTLTHELVHVERGPLPEGLVAVRREEAIVNDIATRRLITIEQLVDAFRWHRHGSAEQLAEELWVDVPTFTFRMNALTPIEVAELENRLDGEWTYAC
ncbi:hypothetical protein [Williamsia soli]|uniref:hypothetical protein n=1 Tax=Williamsia soli TaxID=364929 RepID=UPI001A9DDEF6|nr:hypothetical protein [Williamsia soli]